MKIRLTCITIAILISISMSAQQQSVQDDFEGNGTISSWFGDDCGINVNQDNPYAEGINTSATVLEYNDVGGTYANVRFQLGGNFDLSENNLFSLKIYVPSGGITGSQPNQISFKLQDGNLSEPWSTQSEIIKPLVLDEWQTVEFDFMNDPFINLNGGSLPPTQRNDFNRVVIQVNSEDNNDLVLAYIDDLDYNGTVEGDPIYDFLVWSDEFDGEGAINNLNWHHQTILPNGNSWFNGEVQHYTDETANSNVSDGILNVVAIKENYTDQGVTKAYTSARLNSKFAFTYGKVEVRAKLPSGIGTWPAIWMLGKNINENGAYWQQQGFGTTGWPACGEIDIMEHWGFNQNYVQSAMHTPSSFGATFNVGGQLIPSASDEFHTYTLNWFPDKMVFSVDGNVHYTYDPDEYNADTWPFDAEQYLLLNFAVQAEIDPAFLTDTLAIDYVRIYQTSPVSVSEIDKSQTFKLSNSPNPASNETTISYQLPSATRVELKIVDMNGKQIEHLVSEEQSAGNHQVKWDTSRIGSGIYFYSIQTSLGIETKRCVIQN